MAKEISTEVTPAAMPAPHANGGELTPMGMLQIAVERGADIDQLSKLMDLHERWEKNEARKAFVAALNSFKAAPPSVVKNKHVDFPSKGGRTEYDHATLDQVSEVIGKALSEHGLSHTWKIDQHENAAVQVTCVLTHALGHSEETTLRAMPDASGSKNQIQQIGSTVTYLERYTLLAATGLAAAEQDNDGGTAGSDPIDAAQKEVLIGLIKETDANTAKLCQYFGVSSVDEIPATSFGLAKQMLEKKRGPK